MTFGTRGSRRAPRGLLSGNGLGQYSGHRYQLSDDVTMTLGKHAITAGTDWRFPLMNVKSNGLPDVRCGACCGRSSETGR